MLSRRSLLGAIVAAPFAAVPAAAAAPSPERHVGKMIFAELAVPDLATAERFYGGLFGWTFKTPAPDRPRFVKIALDGQTLGGLFERSLSRRAHHRPGWLPFFSTGTFEATLKIARENGGRVVFGPRRVPGRGEEVILRDPEGAVFGILEAEDGDPPDVLAPPGGWIWSSLVASDPSAAAGFYQKLFGYDVYPLASGNNEEAQHLILASQGVSRASVNPLPSARVHARPHWLNFVRVEDARASTTKSTTLGGSVLVAPHLDPNGGTLALVADPFGAALGLLEWVPASPSGRAP